MTILISKVDTLIQIRIGVDSATFSIMGLMRDQYFFLMTKNPYFLCFILLLILLFWIFEPHFIK